MKQQTTPAAEPNIAVEKATEAASVVKEGATTAWESTLRWASEPLWESTAFTVTPMQIISVVVVVALFYLISLVVRRTLKRVAVGQETMRRASIYALERVLHYAILSLGIVVGLSVAGVDLTKLTLVVSALSVGVGFGLQKVFSNLVAGLMILFERSLKIGDLIELESGLVGQVQEINIRASRIRTFDNVDVIVPNSEFVELRVTNLSLRDPIRRIRIPFGVAYGSDKETVKKAALEAADAVSFTLKDEQHRPEVLLVGFGDSSLDFLLMIWVNRLDVGPTKISATYLWELETALGRHDIEIPFPQRDLHLRSGFPVEVGSATDSETRLDGASPG